MIYLINLPIISEKLLRGNTRQYVIFANLQENTDEQFYSQRIQVQIQMQKQEKKVYLDLNHAFGSNFTLESKNEIGIIEEDGRMKMVYTVGKAIVKQSLENRTMEFIKLSDSIESIECMALSPTKNHIAICEKIKNQNFLLLNLYGLKNRDSQIKHFKLPQTEKQSSFKIIAFSPSQPKYACCMTAEPDNQLMFLDISRSRGLAVSNFTVEGTESIAICPTQSHLISCAGRNIFRLFKVEDYSFKTYEEVKKLPKARNFTAHAWFDKTKILIGTDRGELFMVGPVGNNFQVKRHLGNVFTSQPLGDSGVDLSLSAICVFSKGFIVGSSRGYFSLWMKREEGEESFQDEYTGDLARKWQVGEQRTARVVSIAMCPLEQQIAIAFDSSAIATTSLQALLEAEESEAGGKVIEGDVLNYMYDGFHRGEINSMDICLHRPIFATLSRKENMIRLWNYKKPNCQLIKIFDSKSDGIEQLGLELINCLSLHPLGYYMAVGCCDKLRIYHILENELRNFREIVVRGVCCLKFSNGGQFLAAAYPRQKNTTQKSSVHLINIYNSYTLEEVGRLNDHSNIITDLTWKADDRSLFSVGVDGTATEWRQGDPKSQNKEWVGKKWTQSNAKYSSVMYEKTARSILASGVESGKSVVRQFKIEKDQVQKLFAIGGFKISKLQWLTSQWNIPAVLAGTEEGHLKVFNSVFDNIVEQSINAHRREVTGLSTSPCGRYVISCGRDGIIFVYQVSLTNREGFVSRKLHDQINDYQINPLVGVMDDQLSDIVLVQRNDLAEKNRYNKILEKNLQEMKRKLVIQEDDDNRRFQAELTKLSREKDQIISTLTQQFQELRREKGELQVTAQSSYTQLQGRNQKMLEDLEALYEKKLALENRKYFELQNTFEKQKEVQSQEQTQFMKRMEQTLALLKHQFVQCYRKAEKVHNSQQQAIAQGEKEFSQKMAQVEEQHEGQLRKVSQAIVSLESQKNKSSIEYITNIESLKRECRLLSQQIIRFMSQNETMGKEEEQLQEQLANLSKATLARKQDLLARQELLKNKEQKISEYQQRIADLVKKKDILAYRTWEIRQEIEPRQDEIQFLKEEIYQIELEFEKLLEDEKVIGQAQARIQRQKDTLNEQLQSQRNQTKDRNIKLRRICQQIQTVVQSKSSDRNYYEQQMAAIYRKYFKCMSQNKRNNHTLSGVDEIQRHISHIDREIQDVNRKTDGTLRRRDEEIQRATQENADLIKQLTASREERTKLTQEFKNVQKMVENLMRQIKQIKNMSTLQSKPTESTLQLKKPTLQKPLPGIPSLNLIRSSSQPIVKGKISRGVNYDPGSLSIFTRAKLKELENKLEGARLSLRQREVIARIIKQKIEEHIDKLNCSDPLLRKMLLEFEI